MEEMTFEEVIKLKEPEKILEFCTSISKADHAVSVCIAGGEDKI